MSGRTKVVNIRRAFFTAFISFSFVGCSLFSGDSQKRAAGGQDSLKGTVSKEQYYSLLRRHEDLQKKYNKLTDNKDAEAGRNEMTASLKRELENVPGVQGAGSPAETVDVFAENSKSPIPLPMGAGGEVDEGKLDFEIKELFRAKRLISEKKFDESLKVLQTLEKSSFLQIQVRSKFTIGSLMLDQKEYDLALQVFEEIISRFAFSGYVIESLRKAGICAKRLGLEKKEKQYTSMLYDVFGNS